MVAGRIYVLCCFICITLASCLSGCVRQPLMENPALAAANQTLTIANTASNAIAKNQALLTATHHFIEADARQDAVHTLQQVNPNVLLPSEWVQSQLLKAELDLKAKHPLTAIHQLDTIASAPTLTRQTRVTFKLILARAYLQLADPLTSAKIRIGLTKYLAFGSAQFQANNRVIWQLLQGLSIIQLKHGLMHLSSKVARGWFQLALIAHRSELTNGALSQALLTWKATYLKHPANQFLPSRKQLLSLNQKIHSPLKIGLILPTSGGLEKLGNAIKNGFLAAFYRYHPKPQLLLFDSNQGNIATLYQTAVQKGATFVVGPLTKQHIQTLLKGTTLSVPTLVLNDFASSRLQPNLYSFSLSPLQEANALAKQAALMHHKAALVIAADNAWGHTIVEQFQKVFAGQRGEVVATLWVKPMSTRAVTQAISQVLGTAASNARAHQLRHQLYRRVRSKMVRRRDIDMVFLALPADTVHQVVPLLKFYYAGDLPIYSPSNIYIGNYHQSNNDLNNVRFYAMPWVLTGHLSPTLQALKQSLKMAKWASFMQVPKLYAFGIDAFLIATHFRRLKILPNLSLQGVTGRLHLGENQVIVRQMPLAIMRHGVPQVMNNVSF